MKHWHTGTTFKTILCMTAGLLLPGIVGASNIIVANWDFNDEATYESEGAGDLFMANAGEQSGFAGLTFQYAGGGGTSNFGIAAGGTTENALDGSVTEGNRARLQRGERWDGGTATFDFSASTHQGIQLSFAANLEDTDGPNSFQASYSTDGTSFTDVGLSTSLVSGWETYTVDFGNALDSESNAHVRLTFGGGGAAWNTGHSSGLDNMTISSIPEPGVVALLGLALVMLRVFRRRRK